MKKELENPTRREFLAGVSAASLLAGKGLAELAPEAFCFTSTVEMAWLEVVLVYLGDGKSGGFGPGWVYAGGASGGGADCGRDKADFSVLQLAHAFEAATGFGKRRPGIV